MEERGQTVGPDNGICRVLPYFAAFGKLGLSRGARCGNGSIPGRISLITLAVTCGLSNVGSESAASPYVACRKPRIYAIRSELDLWLKGSTSEVLRRFAWYYLISAAEDSGGTGSDA